MLAAIIIDDEAHCREELKLLLQEVADIQILAEGDSVSSGISLVLEHQPDLIFLDIEMQDGNGFELIEHFNKPIFQVIFTTGHNEYAIKAFKLSAVDYLLKPIDEIELTNAISKAKRLVGDKTNNEKINLLLQSLDKKEFSKIAIPSMDSFEFIEKSEILYCEADSNYSIVHLQNGNKIISTYTLKKMDELLSEEHFYRVHKSFILNVNFVDRILKGNGGAVVMANKAEIPIARRKKDQFFNLLGLN